MVLTTNEGLLFLAIGMYVFKISANLMSLGGLAIAIGMLIDALVVVVENIVGNLTGQGVECEVFPLDVAAFRYAPTADFLGELDRFVRTTANFALVHVQHEYSLFAGSGGLVDSLRHFGHLLSGLRNISRPVVVTFHTEPAFASWLPAAVPDQAISLMTTAGPAGRGRTAGSFKNNPPNLSQKLDLNTVKAGAEWAAANLKKSDPFRVERMSKTDGLIMADGNTAAAIGASPWNQSKHRHWKT